MASKIFLDANVCLSFLLQRKGYEPSETIFERVILNQFKGYTSPAIIHIIAYYLRKIHSLEITKQLITSLLSSVKVIDCNHEIAINAVNSQMTDIEDALQYYTAMHHQIDYFISLDKTLIKSAIPVLPVYSPEEFLKEFE
jgi:putative PIN family toxin of toxin-antitoxin system